MEKLSQSRQAGAEHMMSGPLSDIRVLDAATFLAAPFCGTILGEFGAEVIKIEQPGAGDSLRRFGTMTECGDTLVWMSEARNKKSVTLDLRKPEGAGLFRQLVAQSDVVLENFRPGTMQRWGLGYEELSRINPKLVMLSVSAYGQTGPNREMTGFARTAHAFSGLAYLAGEPGRTPVVPGSTSLADYASGLFGAIGVLIALRHAQRTGEGQQVDIALYESIFRLLDELAPVYAYKGFQRERMGPDTVNVVPHSHYETADGAFVALACSNDRMWERLARAMDRPELAEHPHYAKMLARSEHRDEVNALVAKWVRGLPHAEVLTRCAREEVPCSKLLSISDIFSDPHYLARENLVSIEDPRLGPLRVPSALPRMSRTPPQLRSAGPPLGNANSEVFGRLLGVDAEGMAGLKSRGVI
jgi:crotonobetainyl-CoA:carnitine CoA-transferase CaiB-like acyl-CoA transferase